MASFQASAVSRRYARHLLFAVFVGQVGGDEQGGDLHGHRRGEIAGFLLPAVERRDRAVSDQVADRPAHHRPKELHPVVRQRLLAPGQRHQQDDERRLVELNTVPPGPAADLHVLRPVSVGVLRDAEIEQHAPGVLVQPSGQEGGDRLDHVAGPDQVVAQVAVAVGEAPGSGQTGDNAALESLGFMRAHHGRADVVQVDGRVAGLLQRLEALQPLRPRPHVLVPGGRRTPGARRPAPGAPRPTRRGRSRAPGRSGRRSPGGPPRRSGPRCRRSARP